jgi:predicted metal-dependent HD superfamily phosphohydrolase
VYDQAISPEQFDEIAMALWFHDAVYNPHKNDNELKSVQMFVDLTQHLLDSQIVDNVSRMIQSTSEHKGYDYPSSIVNDIDLAILGSSDTDFDQYEKQIREEYNFVSDEDFFRGRGAILRRLLDAGIYQTPLFKGLFMASAEKNLKRLLASAKYSNKG